MKSETEKIKIASEEAFLVLTGEVRTADDEMAIDNNLETDDERKADGRKVDGKGKTGWETEMVGIKVVSERRALEERRMEAVDREMALVGQSETFSEIRAVHVVAQVEEIVHKMMAMR